MPVVPRPNHGPKLALTEMQSRFVAEYVKDGNGVRSARAAGYSEKQNLSAIAHKMVHGSPAVIAALADARKELALRNSYTAESAMKECDEAIAFAKDTENANAYVKAVELKSKLQGLLIEKHDVRQVGFSLTISRNSKKEEAQEQDIIDAEFDSDIFT